MDDHGRRDLLERATCDEDDERPMPRALVVVAHPDDEVIALGGRLGRWRDASFFHATDGAPVDGKDARAHGFSSLAEYRSARRRELAEAFRMAGIGYPRAREAGIADQRAAWELPALARALLAAMRESRPEVVLTHPYEGGHPDHDACAWAVQAAVRAADLRPVVIEAAFYHQGARGMETGCFLPGGPAEVVRALSAAQRARKQSLLDCFQSQRETLRAFSTEVERFRLAPEYDFARPPHEGALLYEHYPWGITGADFREGARRAPEELAGEVPVCR